MIVLLYFSLSTITILIVCYFKLLCFTPLHLYSGYFKVQDYKKYSWWYFCTSPRVEWVHCLLYFYSLHYRGSYCTFTPLHLSDSYFLRSYYCTELRYLHYSLLIILLYFYLSTLHLSISSHLFISWSDFSFSVYNHYMWELKLLCRLHGGFFNYFILSAKLIRQTLNVGFNNRPSW